MSKKLSLALLFLILTLVAIPFVSASAVKPAALEGAGVTALKVSALSDSSTSAYSARGVCFTANATCYLYDVVFSLRKTGTPEGDLVAQLYDTTGTVGTNAVPTGDLIEFSSIVYAEDLAGSYLPITFTFAGDIELQNGHDYAIVVKVITIDNSPWSSGTRDVAFEAKASADNTKNGVGYHSSAWYATAYTSYMPVFTVNGDTEEYTPPPTATPNPSGSATPTVTIPPIDGGIWTALSPYATLMLPLIIMLVVSVVCGYYGGIWGFFAGLNVSAIMIYAVMGATYFPLWGILVLAVVDVLLVFGKVSGGMGRR